MLISSRPTFNSCCLIQIDWNNFDESLNTWHRPYNAVPQKLWCKAIQKGELRDGPRENRILFVLSSWKTKIDSCSVVPGTRPTIGYGNREYPCFGLAGILTGTLYTVFK